MTKLLSRSDADPSTPDSDVPPGRLAGREFYRRNPEKSAMATEHASTMEKDARVGFWLGWYDGRLGPKYEQWKARAR